MRPRTIDIGTSPNLTVQMPSDAIIRISKTTIFGTDLHILKGDVATCKPGTVLVHAESDRRGVSRYHSAKCFIVQIQKEHRHV